MAQMARRLTPESSAHQRFGAELRGWRSSRELSQDALGRLIHTSGDLIAKIEKAQRWPALDFARRCDAALGTGDALVRLLPQVEAERRRGRGPVRHPATNSTRCDLSSLLAATFPLTGRSVAAVDQGEVQILRMPAGRMLRATTVNAWFAEQVSLGPSHLATVTPSHRNGMRSGDLLITEDVDASLDRPRIYAADARLQRNSQGNETVIPFAYLLDDFTIGILWAARALDEALLDDDRPLAQLLDQVSPTKAVHDAEAMGAVELTEVSQGWLGSYACARFISSHVGASSGPPLFWTREQSGEEAAMWLLFDHKVDYLRTLRDRFPDRLQSMIRVFCLPEATAVASPRAERVLLLLAAALMELMGVAVHVCAESDYSAVEGFVLTPDGTVIVANWLRADRAWHADVVDRRPMVRSYRDVLGFGRAHSIISSATSAGRLERLADYLDIDWNWLTIRAAQLSAVGVGGLIRPRSRLLSTTGIDAACQFLAARSGVPTASAAPPA